MRIFLYSLVLWFVYVGVSFGEEAATNTSPTPIPLPSPIWEGGNMDYTFPERKPSKREIVDPFEANPPLLRSEDQAIVDAVTKPVTGLWNWFYNESMIGKIIQSFLGVISAFLGMLTQFFLALGFIFQWWWVILILLIWKAPHLLKGIGSFMLAFARGLGKGLMFFGGRRWW